MSHAERMRDIFMFIVDLNDWERELTIKALTVIEGYKMN